MMEQWLIHMISSNQTTLTKVRLRTDCLTVAAKGAAHPVDELRVASAAAIAGEVCDPPTGASWVDNRTTPLRRVFS
jgi:hypothetical protein